MFKLPIFLRIGQHIEIVVQRCSNCNAFGQKNIAIKCRNISKSLSSTIPLIGAKRWNVRIKGKTFYRCCCLKQKQHFEKRKNVENNFQIANWIVCAYLQFHTFFFLLLRFFFTPNIWRELKLCTCTHSKTIITVPVEFEF